MRASVSGSGWIPSSFPEQMVAFSVLFESGVPAAGDVIEGEIVPEEPGQQFAGVGSIAMSQKVSEEGAGLLGGERE